MKEVNIYNVVIESAFINSTWNKNFAADSLDDCINKAHTYIEMLKSRQFASDYQIVKLVMTGSIII